MPPSLPLSHPRASVSQTALSCVSPAEHCPGLFLQCVAKGQFQILTHALTQGLEKISGLEVFIHNVEEVLILSCSTLGENA